MLRYCRYCKYLSVWGVHTLRLAHPTHRGTKKKEVQVKNFPCKFPLQIPLVIQKICGYVERKKLLAVQIENCRSTINQLEMSESKKKSRLILFADIEMGSRIVEKMAKNKKIQRRNL